MRVFGLIALLGILCWAVLHSNGRGSVAAEFTTNGTWPATRDSQFTTKMPTTQSSAPQPTTQSSTLPKSTTQESSVALPVTGDPVCTSRTIYGRPFLPEAAVGANITTKCNSGLFEGKAKEGSYICCH